MARQLKADDTIAGLQVELDKARRQMFQEKDFFKRAKLNSRAMTLAKLLDMAYLSSKTRDTL